MKKMIPTIKSLCFFMVLPCVFLSFGCGVESDYQLESAEFAQNDAAQSARPPKCPQGELCLLGSTTDITNGSYGALDVRGNMMVGLAPCGLQIVDSTNPAEPKPMGCLDTPGGIYGVTIGPAGNYAYVAAGQDGVFVVDVSHPMNPALIGQFNPPGLIYAEDVEVKGHLIFIADDNLHVADVSDPGQPQAISFYQTPGWTAQLSVSNGYAYLADWGYGSGKGLHIVDVNNPAEPLFAAQRDVEFLHDVQAVGDKLYGVGMGLDVFDIAIPEDPQHLASLNENISDYRKIKVSRTHAYVTGMSSGVHVINITNSGTLSLATTVDIAGGCTGVDLFGGNKVAFTCGHWGGDFNGTKIYKTLK